MAGKIWRYDCYDLRKFDPYEIDYFLDIGANVGTVTLQAKVLNPKATVIGIEPAKDTFKILKENIRQWENTGIKLYNVALGDGDPLFFHRKGGAGCGMNKFFNSLENKKWDDKRGYTIESKTIKQIFEDYKIDTKKSYIIKIDCEGGERFLLQQQEDFNYYVRNSVQVMMEIHRGLGGGNSYDQWNEWFKEVKDTHELKIGKWVDKHTPKAKYTYAPIDSISGEDLDRRWVSIELINRKWSINK
jgi:FkbM family methyltransferase